MSVNEISPFTFTNPAVMAGTAKTAPRAVDADTLEKDQQLRKACADFESLLVYELLKTMRKTIPKTGLLNSSMTQETFESMMDQKLAEDVASQRKGWGLKEALYEQLTRQTITAAAAEPKKN